MCYNTSMRLKKNKKFLKSGRVAAPDFKFTGDEPTWHNVEKEKRESLLGRCLGFYNYYLDRDDYIPIIQEYMKNNSYNLSDTKCSKNKLYFQHYRKALPMLQCGNAVVW